MRASILALVLAACGGRQTVATPPSDLPLWMEGAWLAADGTVNQHWHAAGGALFGVGFPNDTSFAVMIIDARGFTAWSGGDPALSFTLAARDASSVMFANFAHDFPQAIHFGRSGDQLEAHLGNPGGTKLDFAWRAGAHAPAPALEAADRQFDLDTLRSRSAGWASWFDAEGAMWRAKRGRIVGPEAIRELMRPAFDENGLDLRWTPRHSGLSRKGDLGFTIGDYVARTKSGERSTGGYVTIWRKQADGSWKVLFDTGT